MIEFTPEELYLIEAEFDQLAAQAHRTLKETAHTFLMVGATEYKEGKDNSLIDNVRYHLMQGIEEHHRSIDTIKRIRDKCEAERLKK